MSSFEKGGNIEKMTTFQKLIATFRQNQKYQIVTVLFLLLLGWFYWSQWRPTQIRQGCYKSSFGVAYKRIDENKKGNKEWASGKEWMSNPEKDVNPYSRYAEWGWWYPHSKKADVEYRFATCLNSKGIKATFPE